MEHLDAASAGPEPQVSVVKGARPSPAAVGLRDVARVGPPSHPDASAGAVLPAPADRMADAELGALEPTALWELQELSQSAEAAAERRASPPFAGLPEAVESLWPAIPP